MWPEGQSDGGREDVETLGKMDQDAQKMSAVPGGDSFGS